MTATAELRLAFHKGQVPEIHTIHIEQIERVEIGLPAVEHEVVELGAALVVEADNLTVEDAVLDLQVSPNRLGQLLEPLVRVSLPGDQFAVAVLDVGQGAEAVRQVT